MSLDALAQRIRDQLAGDPRISEKKAFGGIMFLLNGNMLVAAKKDGRILAHVSKDENDTVLEREGANQMVHGDKPMRGFVWVDGYAIEGDEQLRAWLDLAERCAAALPPQLKA